MKKGILWMMCALLAGMMIGCGAGKIEPEAKVQVQNDTETPVYAISMAIADESGTRSSQAGMHADGMPIAPGEKMDFGFTTEDLERMNLADGQALTLTVSITTEPGDDAAETEIGSVSAALTVGETLSLSFSGDAEAGFSLTTD